MKLSDAMVLGSTLTQMKWGLINNCGLGIAATAVGIPDVNRLDKIGDEWPWLTEPTPQAVNRYSDTYTSAIMCRFDNEVFGAKTLSFEDFIAWIRSIEPECGTCNCFKCDCLPVMVGEELLKAVTPAQSSARAK